MNGSIKRYHEEYGTTGYYIEQGSTRDAHEAHLEARRAAWRQSRRIYRRQVLVFAIGAVGFVVLMGWALAGVVMGR